MRKIWERLPAEVLALRVNEPIPRFSFRSIRPTCETYLASIDVSREIRAQLLPHGQCRVQTRHNNQYAYLKEKRRALLKWNRYLERTIDGDPGTKFTDSVRNAPLARRADRGC
jgi:hypothetical protein